MMKDVCPVEFARIVNRICCTAEKIWKYLKLNIRSFDVLLTVHLSIILVINQSNAQILVL